MMKDENIAYEIRRLFDLSNELSHWSIVQDNGNNCPSLEYYGFKTPPCKFSLMQSSLYRIKWTW